MVWNEMEMEQKFRYGIKMAEESGMEDNLSYFHIRVLQVPHKT